MLYGASSGKVPPLDLQRLATFGSLFVTHPALRNYVATRPELLARASEVFGWIECGKLTVRVEATFPLEQARMAHEAMAA